uniref:Uncharacterized protein n=1 Tax=Peronospora matthiolae TaxID=2874970 RepID=A0AAV1UHF2_9STRA
MFVFLPPRYGVHIMRERRSSVLKGIIVRHSPMIRILPRRVDDVSAKSSIGLSASCLPRDVTVIKRYVEELRTESCTDVCLMGNESASRTSRRSFTSAVNAVRRCIQESHRSSTTQPTSA